MNRGVVLRIYDETIRLGWMVVPFDGRKLLPPVIGHNHFISCVSDYGDLLEASFPAQFDSSAHKSWIVQRAFQEV